MSDIDVRRAHNLGLPAAKAAAERMAADLGRKFGLHGGWKGNVLHFERPGLTGALTITDKELHLTVRLGMLLKAMRASIERAVTAELDAVVPARARPPKKAPARRKKAG